MNLIMDIGYNKGEFAKKCFEKYPDCKVIGVEANPSFKGGVWNEVIIKSAHGYMTLITDQVPNLPPDMEASELINKSNNAEQLALGQCEVLNYAVAGPDAPSKVPFYISHCSPTISTASPQFMQESRFSPNGPCRGPGPLAQNWHEVCEVPTITLDKLIEIYGSPDLIKIDIEGYEYEAVKGLSQKQKKICFEWTEENPKLLRDAFLRLSQLGYEEFGIIGHFEEGDVFDKLTYKEGGDEYLMEPQNYFPLPNILLEIEQAMKPSRRINWGMAWCG